MDLFLSIITHYPVAIFSVLLIVAVVYWLIACLGFVDLDAGVDVDVPDIGIDLDIPDAGLDIDLDLDVPDGGIDVGDGYDVDASGMHGPLAGLLLKLRLNGVPLPLVISLIAIFGWLISYFGVLICFNFFGLGILRWILGTVILIVAFVLAIFLTSLTIHPVRKMILKNRAQAVTSRTLVGHSCTIRSPVGETPGQAVCFEGGADHILLVRSHHKGQTFNKGDKVVLLEYLPDTNSYSIISEDEFRGF